MSRLGAGFGAIALVSVAIAGCGGGDDDDTTAAAPVTTEATALSKEELVAQGNAICAEVNAAVGAIGSTSTGSDGQTTQVADLYGGMAERLKGLGAPSDESAGYDEFVGAAEVLAQAQSDVALAAARGEGEALTSAEADASAALSAFQSAATSFGLEQCGEAPAPPSAAATGTGGEAAEAAPEGSEQAAPVEEAAPEAAPETSAPEEESAGGGAAAGGTEGGGSTGGTSGGIGPG